MERKVGYLGIDVSKGYADFVLLGPDKTELEPCFQLQDNAEGRQQLKLILERWLAELSVIYCGVESTGGYENNWYRFLKLQSFRDRVLVSRLNPSGVKAVSEATLKRTITDSVSAHNIAHYLVLFGEKVDYQSNYVSNSQFQQSRQYYNFIAMLVRQKVQLGNQLEKLLYQYYSEVLVYCRNGIPVWLLRMLRKYSSAELVGKAGVKKLQAIKGISQEKAEALVRKSSVSVQSVSPQTLHLIRSTCENLLQLTDQVAAQRQYLHTIYQQDPMVNLLCTIPGVGIGSAVLLLIEIESADRFTSAKKLASYFGVHPTYKQSGDSIWENRMSKKGRSPVRAALYMAAMAGIRTNPAFKQQYARFRAKGMRHKQAMGVLMHKLLRIIYGMLKSGKPFDPSVDQQHVEKSAEKLKEQKQLHLSSQKEQRRQLNRYQKITSEAPISRVAEKKIRKQVAVPSFINEENTGLQPALQQT